ncbi:very short patch repair endonuclease [Pseudomonas neuropathica]|uniref:very short patch repair endonuclease n=1 Tax=Pseudomonas neuropathica TaxID=2730425 RepID=UPI003EBFABE1
MADVVDTATRSKMMAGIKGKNTKPELVVRRYLHGMGYRFRLHGKGLPGKPDIVLPGYKLVIFVHGCFWHRHFDCVYSTLPKTRSGFWNDKLSSNVERDKRHVIQLENAGWRVITIWECGLKHFPDRLDEIIHLIRSGVGVMVWPSSLPRVR